MPATVSGPVALQASWRRSCRRCRWATSPPVTSTPPNSAQVDGREDRGAAGAAGARGVAVAAGDRHALQHEIAAAADVDDGATAAGRTRAWCRCRPWRRSRPGRSSCGARRMAMPPADPPTAPFAPCDVDLAGDRASGPWRRAVTLPAGAAPLVVDGEPAASSPPRPAASRRSVLSAICAARAGRAVVAVAAAGRDAAADLQPGAGGCDDAAPSGRTGAAAVAAARPRGPGSRTRPVPTTSILPPAPPPGLAAPRVPLPPLAVTPVTTIAAPRIRTVLPLPPPSGAAGTAGRGRAEHDLAGRQHLDDGRLTRAARGRRRRRWRSASRPSRGRGR